MFLIGLFCNPFQAQHAEGPSELLEAVEPIMDVIQLAGCEKYLTKKLDLVDHLISFIAEERLNKAYAQ